MPVSGADGRAGIAVPPVRGRRSPGARAGTVNRIVPPRRGPGKSASSGAGPACTGRKSSHRRPFTAVANSFLPVDACPSGEAKQRTGWVSLDAQEGRGCFVDARAVPGVLGSDLTRRLERDERFGALACPELSAC